MDDDDSLSSAGEVSAMAVSDPYYRKFAALRRRCQSVQQENRRLVRRLYYVQRLVSRTRQQCRLVATRLDSHGDDYRQAALRAPTATEDGQVPETKLPREVPELPTPRRKPDKKPKKKRRNEPKRPSNAFFQYCQEQRSLLLSQMKPSTSNLRGLTKQLAANWGVMSLDDKQKYVDRYERDKRQYATDMQRFKNENNLQYRPEG